MPFLLVRDGKLIVQDARLAGDNCTDCCGTRPEARYVKVVDCCFPTEVFWIRIIERCADGTLIWTEGGPPRTFGLGSGCATTVPNVVRTLPEILAEDPDASIVFYATPPECRDGCNDPSCAPCPQCCVAGQINGCNGPLCCEHGGSFNVTLGVSFSYVENRRVWGLFQRGLDCVGLCPSWSGEAISASNTAFVQIRALFTCQANGEYAVQCAFATRQGRSDVWRVDGPEHPACFPPANEFVPIRTLVASQSVNDGCDVLVPQSILTPGQFFPLTRGRAIAFLPDLIYATLDGLGLAVPDPNGSVVEAPCSGFRNTLERIDRTWTTDPCEAILDGMGTLRGHTGSWTGNQDCEGGTYTYQNEYRDGRTLKTFFPSPWQSFVSSATTLVQAEWSVERVGPLQCDPPQCQGGPAPVRLLEGRASRPVRNGCGGCGRDGGL